MRAIMVSIDHVSFESSSSYRYDKLTRGVHETAHYETGSGAAGQVQSRTLFHTQVAGQTTLSEEVGRELNSTAETGSNHGGANTTVDTLDTLGLVDLAQAIKRVLVVVLSTNGKERRK